MEPFANVLSKLFKGELGLDDLTKLMTDQIVDDQNENVDDQKKDRCRYLVVYRLSGKEIRRKYVYAETSARAVGEVLKPLGIRMNDLVLLNAFKD